VEKTINQLLRHYEEGKLSRRQLVGGLTMLAARSASAAPEESSIKAISVNHVAITVSDLKKSTAWYKDLFGLKAVVETEKMSELRFGPDDGDGLVLRPGQRPGTISHFMFGVSPYNEEALKAELIKHGLEPRKDMDSFHVKDPDGLDVQVGDKALRGTSIPVSRR
jgi:catechol 2,3-dioxygenase-like lactoylglutathione lyase family enzyme